MARLLSAAGAAKRAGLGVKRFRAICRSGQGPRVFNPLDGIPQYVDTVVDAWLEARDDRPQRGAA
jgi:hypothetical protein